MAILDKRGWVLMLEPYGYSSEVTEEFLKQFTKKRLVNGPSFVAQKLLHVAEDFAWFAIA